MKIKRELRTSNNKTKKDRNSKLKYLDFPCEEKWRVNQQGSLSVKLEVIKDQVTKSHLCWWTSLTIQVWYNNLDESTKTSRRKKSIKFKFKTYVGEWCQPYKLELD